MTREELEEIFHIKKEIQDLEKRVERIEKQSEMVSDVVQRGYKQHAIIYGVDVKRAYKLQSNYARLRKFKIKLVDKEKEIENYIEVIPFSEIRQIFRYRYLDGMELYRVALKMNEKYNTDKYNEDNIGKKINRYLEKNI